MASLAALGIVACSPQAPRPNLLLVTVDTLRADHLEPYGYARPTSPALARFAAGAALFEAAQAQSSWTLPSLATLMTGTYPSNHDVLHFAARVETSYPTLAELLRGAGYDTAAIANHVFLARPYGFQQGFTHYNDDLVRIAEREGMHKIITSEEVTDRAVDWIEHQAAARDAERGNGPWMLWAHYFDPHNEYRFHPGTSEPFADADGGDLDLYDGEIAYTDRALGRLFERLEALGFREDTIVVLVSDHGEAFGEHGRTKHSDSLYQELVNVPLLIRAPGYDAQRVAEPVQVADILPTLLELTAIEPPPGLDGRSLVPALRGELLPEAPVIAEVDAAPYEPGSAPEPDLLERTRIRSLTLGRWKLVRQDTGVVELYDLEEDPGELENLAGEQPERVERMERQLMERVEAAAERGAQIERAPSVGLSAEELQALEALGYAENH